MKILIIMLIIAGFIAVLILWSALTVPLSEYDRKVDDEAQEEFLKTLKRTDKNVQVKWIFKNQAYLNAITAVGVGIDKAKLECPKCGYEAIIDKENRNRCPNCGAKLIGIKGICEERSE